MTESSQNSCDHTASGLDALIRATLARLRSGEQIDVGAIEKELGESHSADPNRAFAFRALLNVSKRASSSNVFAIGSLSSGGSDDSADSEADVEEDIELLRANLAGYQIIERIDRGGQGAVYLAEQKSTNRPVAIKVLLDGPLATEQQKSRFRREVRLSSQLQHANIVSVYDSGTVRGRHYLAMEYVEGIPIDGYVVLNRLGVQDCVRMFLKVCRAVSHAHQRGVIHRDIKPSNILVDMDGEPHILDFGFAKAREVIWEDDTAQISASRQAVGTLQYMSPERVSCREDGSDVRSDVYALGVVLYQLISGQLPTPLDDDREKMRMDIAAGRIRSLKKVVDGLEPEERATRGSVSEDLNQIVLKSLACEKEHRYQSADAFAEDLEHYLRGEPVNARSGNKRYVLRATMRKYRRQIAVVGAFVALLLVGLVGALIMWRHNAENARMWQEGLTMGSYVHLGGIERDEGRTDQAIAMFEQAIRIAENSPVVDGEILRRLFSSHNQLGLLYADSGREDEALKHAAAILQVADRLKELEPETGEVRMWLAHAAAIRARVATKQRAWEDALHDLSYARTLCLDLIKETDANEGIKKALSTIEENRAVCLRKLGRSDEAKEALQSRLTLTLAALEARPNSLDAQVSVVYAILNMGIWHMQTKTPQGYEQALRLFDDAEMRIAEINESGRGIPRQRDINLLQGAIENNRRIVRKRQERAAEEAEAAKSGSAQ